jgi:single-strand DNA-binding protein
MTFVTTLATNKEKLVNNAILFGRLGKDPETKYLPNGQGVTSFSVATSKKWKTKEGEAKEQTQWHSCQAWAKTGEIIAKYFKKGDQILVQGEIQYTMSEKDGQKTYFTKINVTEFNFVGSGKKQEGQAQGAQGQDNFTSDDIPF